MLADILSAGISGQARDGEAGASSRALGKSVHSRHMVKARCEAASFALRDAMFMPRLAR
jgi:hypothetical protein